MKAAALSLAAALTLGPGCAALAQDLPAKERFSGTTVAFDLDRLYGVVTLSISGPNAFHVSATARSVAPEIDLRKAGGVDDGQYTYQLSAGTDEKLTIRTPLDDGRDRGPATTVLKAVSTSGVINVKDGVIVPRDPTVREPQQKRK